MPNSEASSTLKPEHGHFLGHWKSKIRTKYEQTQHKDAHHAAHAQNDVSDFLSARPTSRGRSVTPTSQGLGRLDVSAASRWPSAAELKTLTRPTSSGQPSRDISQTSSREHRTRPNRKGTNVQFTEAPPAIIGEGGDEAEEPVTAISRYRSMRERENHSQSTSGNISRERSPYGGQVPARKPVEGNGDAVRPKPFRRAPTGFRDASSLPPQLQPAVGGSPDNAEPQSSGSTRDTVTSRQAKMRAEEGAALVSAPQESSSLQHKGEASMLDRDLGRLHMDPLPSPGALASQEPSPIYPTTPTSGSPELHMTPGAYPQRPSSSRSSNTNRSAPRSDMIAVVPHAQSDPTSVRSEALDAFSSRLQHLTPRFHAVAESYRPLHETSFSELIRAAVWWFLKGRVTLESVIRGQRTASSTPVKIEQAYVDLGKAWWICQSILSQHPEARRYGDGGMRSLIEAAKHYGDQDLAGMIEVHQAVVSNLRGVTNSMAKNGLLPQYELDPARLSPDVDLKVWVDYPAFNPEVRAVLSGTSFRPRVAQGYSGVRSVKDCMPLGDDGLNFAYGRAFVTAVLTDEVKEMREFDLACVLTMTRIRNEPLMSFTITSQSGLVDIKICSSKSDGPTWEDVLWRRRYSEVEIKLLRGFKLRVRFEPNDFTVFEDLFTRLRESVENMKPRANEQLAMEFTPARTQCISNAPTGFLSEPTAGCEVRLYERSHKHQDGLGARKMHRGSRLAVSSGSATKHPCSLSFDFNNTALVEYGLLRSDDGLPAILFKNREAQGQSSLLLTFDEERNRMSFLARLQGTALQDSEAIITRVKLGTVSIIDLDSYNESRENEMDGSLNSMGWFDAQIINKTPSGSSIELCKTILSENLRVCLNSKMGTIVDRINISPGQLQLGLDHTLLPSLKVLRPAQEDLLVFVAENMSSGSLLQRLRTLQSDTRSSDTVRTYHFPSLNDLHIFQAALTGFSILFDGIVSGFAISRRRMVVPIYKHWEAVSARVQIVRQDRITQLLVFFDDSFSHGKCMNFQLKETDVYESFSKSGKFHTRLVDAKFALPKSEEVESRDFVCLDMPEYPGEHDDIRISFDGEAEHDAFLRVLPATVTRPTRINTMKR